MKSCGETSSSYRQTQNMFYIADAATRGSVSTLKVCSFFFVALRSVRRAASGRLSVGSSRLPTEPPAPPAGWRVLPGGRPSPPQGPLWAPSPWQHISAASEVTIWLLLRCLTRQLHAMYGRVAEESAQHEAGEQQTIQKDSVQVLGKSSLEN